MESTEVDLGGDALSDHLEELLTFLDTRGRHLHVLLTRLTLREDVAEDLMQELFLKLSQSKSFHRAVDPAAYAYRAAIHLAFDWRRSQARTLQAGRILAEPAVSTPSALSGLLHREELEHVLAALDRLPEVSRDAILLRYLQEESYERIAQQLGKTPHHVRSLCHKAITRLRSLLSHTPPLPAEKEVPHVDT